MENKTFLIYWCFILSLIFTVFFHLLQSNEIMKQQIKINRLDSLYKDLYFSFVDSNEKLAFLVTATTFNATRNQCDDRFWETACQFKIDTLNPFKQRIISISRDLQSEFYFGEKVIIENCKDKKYNGEYTILDLGNARLVRTIDICINKNQLGGLFKNVVLRHKN